MGCFWGSEELFRTVKGVKDTKVGFMGGATKNPSYEEVCSGTTGHTEVVQVDYDPSIVSYKKLLSLFWKNHNPTVSNLIQYRSVIFYHDKGQLSEAQKGKLETEKKLKAKIFTKVEKAGTFWKAEEYHQKYYLKNGGASSCRTK